jgi:C-terminal processing protease CtpA/Prc
MVEGKTMTQKERRAELKNKKAKRKNEPYKCAKLDQAVIACKLHTFVTDKDQIDKMMKEVASHQKLILDLRGNGGGYVETEEHLMGYLFPKDVKIADVITRKKTEVRMAKSRGEKAFKGELVILVDSRSASASEMVARVIQIEKRGKVIGDVSSGAVMTSIYVPLFSQASAFADIVISSVGMSVTVADVVMSDGSRLEKIGVIPDVPLIPTGLALSTKVDVILSYAAHTLGVPLAPDAAGRLQFLTDKDDDEDLSGDEEP